MISRAETHAKRADKIEVEVLIATGQRVWTGVVDYAAELGYAVNLDMGDGSTLQVFPDGKTIVHLPDFEYVKSTYHQAKASDAKVTIPRGDTLLPYGHENLDENQLGLKL